MTVDIPLVERGCVDCRELRLISGVIVGSRVRETRPVAGISLQGELQHDL